MCLFTSVQSSTKIRIVLFVVMIDWKQNDVRCLSVRERERNKPWYLFLLLEVFRSKVEAINKFTFFVYTSRRHFLDRCKPIRCQNRSNTFLFWKASNAPLLANYVHFHFFCRRRFNSKFMAMRFDFKYITFTAEAHECLKRTTSKQNKANFIDVALWSLSLFLSFSMNDSCINATPMLYIWTFYGSQCKRLFVQLFLSPDENASHVKISQVESLSNF